MERVVSLKAPLARVVGMRWAESRILGKPRPPDAPVLDRADEDLKNRLLDAEGGTPPVIFVLQDL